MFATVTLDSARFADGCLSLTEFSTDLVSDVKVGWLGWRELRMLALDEDLSDLVAVEGVGHEECC